MASEFKPLQVGDRVRVGEVSGAVCEIENTYYKVELDEGGTRIIPRLRRLRPKAKPAERVERWINVYDKSLPGDHAHESPQSAAEGCASGKPGVVGRGYIRTVHCVELRPGEVPVHYDMLANAMDSLAPSVFDGVGNALMTKFCAALGVPYQEAK